MPWKKNNPGCPCCECNRTLVVHGCNNTAIGGKVVTLSQGGVTKASCTTGDGTGGTTLGQCIVSIPAGTYDVSIPAGDNYAAFSGTLTQTCPGGGSSTFNLSPASGYVCETCCNVPIATSLFTSDGEGTHTLAYEGTGTGAWSCIYTPAIASTDFHVGGCFVNGSMTVLIRYSCAAQTLTITWSGIRCGDVFTGIFFYYSSTAYNAGPNTVTVSANASSSACSPFSATFSMPTKSTGAGDSPPSIFIADADAPGRFTPGGGGTMTVTP